MPEIEWLPVPAARFPSPPVWHGGERALYWSDIDACRLFRLNAADGAVETILDDGRPTGAIVPQADGSLLLFRDRGNVVAMRGGALAETVVPDIADFRKTRCAAAAADKSGRVVCAFLSDSHHQVRYMLLDRSGRYSALYETTGIPSGMAFACDGGALFASNMHPTCPEISKAIYDSSAAAPDIRPAEKIADFLQPGRPVKGVPAGLAAVADGSVAVAVSGDSLISQFAPSGGVLRRLQIPARRPVGLCFGGEALGTLFVTAAGAHSPGIDGEHAGGIAAIRGFATGAAPFPARIGLPDGDCLPEVAGAGAEPAAQESAGGASDADEAAGNA